MEQFTNIQILTKEIRSSYSTLIEIISQIPAWAYK